jgi:hypothetical protein
MSLPTPNLDDRTFHQLLEEARNRIVRASPEWTDLSPHDPGMVLLEVFAHLTETMLYRLNRLPEKAYVEFLRLIGVRLQPPSAASVRLRFSLARPSERPVEIPRGTGVTTASRADSGSEPVVFLTAEAVRIPVGGTEAEVLAWHAEQVDAELVGHGTGQPGLSVSVRRPPIVAPTGDGHDLVVGVEAEPDELDGRVPARKHGEKTFRIWREVESFANLLPDDPAYMVDRMTGTLTFAPAARVPGPGGVLTAEPRALAAVPRVGRAICVWYLRGGGLTGNVVAGALDTLKVALPGVKVTNPEPAVGGRAAETVENALVRGPQELHSLGRAITAQDYERLALRSSGAVVRAKAFTEAQLWAHALPGAVEVLLVPWLPPEVQGRSGEGVTESALRRHETEEARVRIQDALEERRPLGTTCRAEWARCKEIWVEARVVAHRAEDLEALKRRSLERLYLTLNPLPTKLQPQGWRFGQALRASHVYDILLSEPGVSYVDRVRLWVKEVPREVRTLAEDTFQPRTFYAGGGESLFRTVTNADGWEKVGDFPGEQVEIVEAHPQRAGLVAVAARVAGEPQRSRLHLSLDSGETWERTTHTLDHVEDLAWMMREGGPVLLLATRVGLFELAVQPGATPLQVLVEPADQDLGFFAVAASQDARGGVSVAVAGMGMRGVYLSSTGGRSGSFRSIGLRNQDVRVLEVQHDGPRSFLWAGLAALSGADPGKGCLSWELLGSADPPEGWRAYDKGWEGGSCLALAFDGAMAYAATHRAGVLWLDASRREATWSRPGVDSGLPLRERERLFQPVQALALAPGGGLLLSGGPAGVHRQREPGGQFESCSAQEFTEKVTLPPTWLLCSGAHKVEVVSVDEAE